MNVHGEARKFSFIPTLLNLGAGLALLSVSTIICDILVLYCHKHKKYFNEKKYLVVTGDDAWRGFGNENEPPSNLDNPVYDVSNDGDENKNY